MAIVKIRVTLHKVGENDWLGDWTWLHNWMNEHNPPIWTTVVKYFTLNSKSQCGQIHIHYGTNFKCLCMPTTGSRLIILILGHRLDHSTFNPISPRSRFTYFACRVSTLPGKRDFNPRGKKPDFRTKGGKRAKWIRRNWIYTANPFRQ